METKEFKFGQPNNVESQISSGEKSFINMEFMRYYAIKQHITDEAFLPTNPKNFYDQIQFAEISGTSYLYLNINNTWKKVALT